MNDESGRRPAPARTTLTASDLDALVGLVRRHWPELNHYERSIVTLALNRVQAIAEQEGVAAITAARLAGQREIIEEYLLPFAEVARIRDLLTANPQAQEPS